MLFQAATCHVFIDQLAVLILTTVPNQPHKIRMTELSQVVNFSLQDNNIRTKQCKLFSLGPGASTKEGLAYYKHFKQMKSDDIICQIPLIGHGFQNLCFAN